MKQANWSNYLFSLFIRKLKSKNAWDHIEKLNERGKKRLNAKLERHLARSHTLPYEVSAFIYTSL